MKKLKEYKQPIMTTLALSTMLLLYQNCQRDPAFFANKNFGADIDKPDEGEIIDDDKDLCEIDASNIICNPLGGDDDEEDPVDPTIPRYKLGLIAKLYEGQSNWNHLDEYFEKGYEHPDNLYFSNFNVPNRSFTQGFGYDEENYLRNINGERLIEWFAIKAHGYIRLPESSESGYYHIATSSDDGIEVKINNEVVVSNKDIHSETIDCANAPIYLEKGEELPFELGYFQGPREHIALVVLVKKIDDVDAYRRQGFCGTGGSHHRLLEDGYSVIGRNWFTLPSGY